LGWPRSGKATKRLVEAKSSAARVYALSALEQALDCARFLSHKSKAVPLPARPSDDLVDLLLAHGCAVIWEDGSSFQRDDP
jgi:hypothetical protein